MKLRLPQGACEAQHYFSERDRSLLRTRKGRVARRVSGLNICLSDMAILFCKETNSVRNFLSGFTLNYFTV